MAKGEAKLRALLSQRDKQVLELARRLDVLVAGPKMCDRCVHRMCSECGKSLLGSYSSAVTCSEGCRKARQRRVGRALGGDITLPLGSAVGDAVRS